MSSLFTGQAHLLLLTTTASAGVAFDETKVALQAREADLYFASRTAIQVSQVSYQSELQLEQLAPKPNGRLLALSIEASRAPQVKQDSIVEVGNEKSGKS